MYFTTSVPSGFTENTTFAPSGKEVKNIRPYMDARPRATVCL